MTADGPDLSILAARLEALVDRLDNLEVRVRALVTSQTVEAREFVVKEMRGAKSGPGWRCKSTPPASPSMTERARSG